MVVDFTVKDDLERSVAVAHGLRSCVGKINDGQAAMGQTNAAVRGDPQAGAIGATVHHRLPHPEKIVRRDLEVAGFKTQYAGDSAHL
jgi:hypothetical protein